MRRLGTLKSPYLWAKKIARIPDGALSSGRFLPYINTAIIIAILLFSDGSAASETGAEVKLISGLSLGVLVLSFLCGYFDASLGMGYGSTLTPILLILGFTPLQIVPSILVAQFVGGFAAGFAHHKAGNVNLKPGSYAFKLSILLAVSSIIGSIVGVSIAVHINAYVSSILIGVIITSVGIVVIMTYKKEYTFHWWKMAVIGVFAAFNKGISGGGYGPVVTGGQIVSGVKPRQAVGVTQLSEGLVCIAGIIVYLAYGVKIDWVLTLAMFVGALIAIPLSAITVRALQSRTLTFLIGGFTTILGIVALLKGFGIF